MKFSKPLEGVLAGCAIASAFLAGAAFQGGLWLLSGATCVLALIALSELRDLTDEREQRAFDNGVRRMTDEAKAAIRETAKPTVSRTGGFR